MWRATFNIGSTSCQAGFCRWRPLLSAWCPTCTTRLLVEVGFPRRWRFVRLGEHAGHGRRGGRRAGKC
eukprot:4950319-Pyramimonas_sp.AAC.1